MHDLKVDHSKDCVSECFGVESRDMKKFMIDVVEDGGDKISKDLEYIWNSDTSIEMKIVTLFTYGKARGAHEAEMMNNPIMGILKAAHAKFEKEEEKDE